MFEQLPGGMHVNWVVRITPVNKNALNRTNLWQLCLEGCSEFNGNFSPFLEKEYVEARCDHYGSSTYKAVAKNNVHVRD